MRADAMNPDVIFLLGLLIFGLSVPAVISAFSTSGSTLRPAAMCVLVGGTMIVWAMSQSTTAYSVAMIPDLVKGLFH